MWPGTTELVLSQTGEREDPESANKHLNKDKIFP